MKKFLVLALATVMLAACEYETTIKEVTKVPTSLAEQVDANEEVQLMLLDHRNYVVVTTANHVAGKVQVENNQMVVDITEGGNKEVEQQHIFRIESSKSYDTIIVKVNGEEVLQADNA